MFTFMVASALQRGKRCIIFTDRVELLKQSNGALDQFGIVPTLIEAGKPRLDVSGNCFIAIGADLRPTQEQGRLCPTLWREWTW
jgi:hypothetical protein